MGRPIKKIWFTVEKGSTVGDLTLTTTTGDEPIIAQKGTGVYDVVSGRVKLVDKAAPTEDNEAVLLANGNRVRKITQYRMYFFDDSLKDIKWREGDGSLASGVVLAPVLTHEGDALASASISNGAVTSFSVVNGGHGYANTVPAVTISAPIAGTDATADGFTLTAANLTSDAINTGPLSATITDAGSGYSGTVVVTVAGGTGTGATAEAVINSDGEITDISITDGGSGFANTDSITFTIPSPVSTTATGTAVLDGTGDSVVSITITEGGAGYYAEPTVTIANP